MTMIPKDAQNLKDEEGHMMTETTTAPRAPRSLLAFLREGRGGNSSTSTRAISAKAGKKKRKKNGWTLRKMISLALLVVIPLSGVAAFAGTANAATGSGDEVSKALSFYGLGSATTAFFSDVNAPNSGKTMNSNWDAVTTSPANGGSMLGWADPDFNASLSWLTSSLSGTSDAMGYATLKSAGSTKYGGVLDYAYFGATLSGLGLDSTSTGMGLGFFESISGAVIALLYLLAMFVDSIFGGFMTMLSVLNPFKLLYGAISLVNPAFADGMTGGSTEAWGPLSGLAAFISQIYTVMNQAAWGIMVPLFIGILLFSIVVFKKMSKGGALKKLLIRIVFIAVGVPLLGSMYTGTIDSMAEATSGANTGATQIVLSTYVDFGAWANINRLAIPDGATIEWRAARGQPSTAATMKVRETALAINASSHSVWSSVAPLASDADSLGWSASALSAGEGDNGGGAYLAVMDMLSRYMTGARVESGSFESEAKGDITSSALDDTSTEKWFSSIRSGDIENPDPAPADNPVLSVAPGTGLTRTSFHGSGDSADSVDESSWVRVYTTQGVSGQCGSAVSNTSGQPLSCNLSPLAMYNFLNTSFGPSSMTTYSSNKVMSGATRESHNAVSQVGTGAMGFLYWFNSVVLLGAFVTIGLGYALSMLMGNIRRGIQTISAIPFATLGAIAAIAKVVVYTVAMILEVVLTLFLYQMMQQLLMAIPKIIEYPFSMIASGGTLPGANAGFLAFLTSGGALTIVITLLSIIGVVAFTVMAMRLRKSIMKAVEEAVTKLVEKFMETSAAMPSGGKMLPALAGGMAAGAGAAAANRMMSGGQNKGAVANPTDVTGEGKGSPEVETAGGTAPTGDGTGPATDGQLEITGDVSGADDNGDKGSALGSSTGDATRGGTAAKEVALGRQVEANGLSKQGETRAPQVGGDDAMSAASDSVDKSTEGYKAADRKHLEAGKDGAQAVGHAGVAVGKGFAGDAAGAAESGGRAVEHGGAAAAAGHEAKQMEADAGRNSLDKPNDKSAQKAAQARKVSQAGGTVANAAGAASATSGAGSAAKGSSAAKGAPATKGAVTPKATTAKAPKQAPSQAPKQPAQAPKQTQAPKQAPKRAPAQVPAQAPKQPVRAPKPPKQVQSPQPPRQAQAPKAPRAPQRVTQAPQPRASRPVKQAPKQAPKNRDGGNSHQ